MMILNYGTCKVVSAVRNVFEFIDSVASLHYKVIISKYGIIIITGPLGFSSLFICFNLCF